MKNILEATIREFQLHTSFIPRSGKMHNNNYKATEIEDFEQFENDSIPIRAILSRI